MKMLIAFAVLCLGLISAGKAQFPPEPLPTNTTTASPLTPNTTVTSSTEPTTKTTPAPTTSTTVPTTSTKTTPTTKPTPTPTSTVSPTTPPVPHSTTPAPTPNPPPNPEIGKWSVKDDTTNVTCIIVDMEIHLNVSYIKNGNETSYGTTYVPINSSATGSCGNSSQILELKWHPSSNFTNFLNMTFKKNVTEKKFMLSDIALTLQLDPVIFPGADKNTSEITLQHDKTLLTTSLTKSYKCIKVQDVELTGTIVNKTLGWLKISHVQLEAFHETNSTEFGAVEDCESSSSTDIVPIAVGCALVGLVAIVLVSYLVGRRRSQARGYLSM